MPDNEFIYFVDETAGERKTKLIAVMNRKGNYALGYISWWGPWRQYAFRPGAQMTFNKGCMESIIEKIDELMTERRKRETPNVERS